MHFMDFRRHHSGLWRGKALHPGTARALTKEQGWGNQEEVPSFLYAMPLGGNKAFFQETCLVSKDALPFEVRRSFHSHTDFFPFPPRLSHFRRVKLGDQEERERRGLMMEK